MEPTDKAALAVALEVTLPPQDDAPIVGTLPPAEADSGSDALVAAEATADPADTLSPAVRRLVRQYDLDITGIHGTGPSGRIRVGDVIGMLGGRAEPARPESARTYPPDGDDRSASSGNDRASGPSAAAAEARNNVEPTGNHAPLISTIFECDLSRVLSHRQRQRRDNVERLLTSYFLVAYEDALKVVAELTEGRHACFGVQLTTADGALRSLLVDTAHSAQGSLDERLGVIDTGLRANLDVDLSAANVLVHHHGASGSLIATPTPIGAGHAASLGIGRLRREVVVRNVDGEEAPRVAAVCRLSLSFYQDRVALHRANHFMAHAVQLLEQWPE